MITPRCLQIAALIVTSVISCSTASANQSQSPTAGGRNYFDLLPNPTSSISGVAGSGRGIQGQYDAARCYANLVHRNDRLQNAGLQSAGAAVGPGGAQGGVVGAGDNNRQQLTLTLGAPPSNAQAAQPCTNCGNPPQQNLTGGYSLLRWPFTAQSHVGPDSPSRTFYYWEPSDRDAGSVYHSQAEGGAAFESGPPSYGIAPSDVDLHLACTSFAARAADDFWQPQRQAQMAQAQQQQQMQSAANAAAEGAEANFSADMTQMLLSLINVANEDASIPGAAQQATKLLPQAIWMVQQMFHKVYIPLAILLLLPGALMTHMKAMVQYGILGGHPEDEEMRGPSPFTAIFRSMIAIFLIPATQLVVSWMIDIGNSMTYEVTKYIVPLDVINWAQEQTFNPPPGNQQNQFTPPATDPNEDPESAEQAPSPPGNPNGSPTNDNPLARGVNTGFGERVTTPESQSAMAGALQAGFNIANFSLGAAITVLIGFQIVTMCYLMLMGPIAAAFYAWPSGVGSLFKKVFINWVDAVMNLALWRFWWCVVILIMSVRITWLKSLGQYYPNSQWEMAMYTAFMVILAYVPFMPFEFKPGEMVAKVLEKAEQGSKGGGGGGGGGGGEDGANPETSPESTERGRAIAPQNNDRVTPPGGPPRNQPLREFAPPPPVNV